MIHETKKKKFEHDTQGTIIHPWIFWGCCVIDINKGQTILEHASLAEFGRNVLILLERGDPPRLWVIGLRGNMVYMKQACFIYCYLFVCILI